MKTRAFKIRSRSDKKSRSIHITIEGETGVNQIESIKKKLDLQFSEAEKITIDLRNIISFDLSIFQLLFSLKKNMNQSGWTVNINAKLPEGDETILNNCGLGDFIKRWNQN